MLMEIHDNKNIHVQALSTKHRGNSLSLHLIFFSTCFIGHNNSQQTPA